VESRPFRDPSDLRLLVELARDLWHDDPRHVDCTSGQIAFWSALLPRNDWTARLWFDGDALAGWGWLTRAAELEAQVRPSHRQLLDDILAWGQPARMLVRVDNTDAIERVRAHGLEHDPAAPWMRVNVRALDEIDEPRLPAGYRLRTIADGADIASRAAAHRSAFHPSRFTDDVYGMVRSTWPYRADLDCVVEAPDGSVVAYSLAWLDEDNRVGELEPVGTHADYRRRGFGRAANLFALWRLRDEGATHALVGCRGDSAYPIPCRLYESIGFHERTRSVAFRKAT